MKCGLNMVQSVQKLKVNASNSSDPNVNIFCGLVNTLGSSARCIINSDYKMLRSPHGDVHKKVLTPFFQFIFLVKICRKKYRPHINRLYKNVTHPTALHRAALSHKYWPATGYFAFKQVTLLSTTFLKSTKKWEDIF